MAAKQCLNFTGRCLRSACSAGNLTKLGRLFHQPAQLLDWLWIVVDLEAKHGVVMQPDAAVLPHDQERGGLHPPFVTTCGLPSLECRQQPIGEVALRPLETRDHTVDDRRPGKNISLSG